MQLVKVASIVDSMSVWEQTENRVSILGRKLRERDATDDWMIRYLNELIKKNIFTSNFINFIFIIDLHFL